MLFRSGVLPLWDSLDWMSFVLAFEEELGEQPPEAIEDWRFQGSFSVKQLVQASCKPRLPSFGSESGP